MLALSCPYTLGQAPWRGVPGTFVEPPHTKVGKDARAFSFIRTFPTYSFSYLSKYSAKYRGEIEIYTHTHAHINIPEGVYFMG